MTSTATTGGANAAGGPNGAQGGANGASRAGGATGSSGGPSRRGRGRRSAAKPSQTPSDAVLTEALSSAPAAGRDGNGGELAPGAGEKLQRNVEEALDHAEE